MSANAARNTMSRSIRLLCQHGEKALKPLKVNDRWRPPMLSARVQAKIRKDATVDGTFGSFDSSTGKGWDPNWDKIDKVSGFSMRYPKLHKNERNREERARKIETLMEGMDKKIDDYRKAKIQEKPEPGIMTIYNKIMKTKKK